MHNPTNDYPGIENPNSKIGCFFLWYFNIEVVDMIAQARNNSAGA